jgi:hypothetical protein
VDDQLLLHLYHRLFDPPGPRPARGCVYGDAIVALVHFLAVVRGRSMRWAHAKRNWPLWMRRLDRPGYSQLMRRLKTKAVRLLIVRLNLEFRGELPDGAEKFCDGKPLTVGGFSKDPDARPGKLPGDGWGRGYKVHLLVDACGAVDVFTVTALDAGEPTVMRGLIGWARFDDGGGRTVRADSGYDSNPLYAGFAERGARLIATRKKPGTGLGHHRQHPHRLLAIEQLERSDAAAKAHRRHRIRVEQALAHVTNLPFGLSPLPNHVRRLPRVRLWVLSKITLYHLYLMLRQQKALAA